MKMTIPKPLRCAIYTRKSTEHNLDLAFNSLDAQREACEAYIKSQAHEGWRLLPEHYDDGGLSGASLERPALQQLLSEVREGRVDVIVVYKVDRLTRSLADFAKLVETFDEHGVSFVSVTQSFNTTSSMGRLTSARMHVPEPSAIEVEKWDWRDPHAEEIVASASRIIIGRARCSRKPLLGECR
jgi:site-specific DNA recombinase